jgi:hypothetical protein
MKLTAKKILAIGAHPDDIEYGCFGYFLRDCILVESIRWPLLFFVDVESSDNLFAGLTDQLL